jgi:hypothetical protein
MSFRSLPSSRRAVGCSLGALALCLCFAPARDAAAQDVTRLPPPPAQAPTTVDPPGSESPGSGLLYGGAIATLLSLPPLITAGVYASDGPDRPPANYVEGAGQSIARGMNGVRVAAFLIPGIASLGVGATLLIIGSARGASSNPAGADAAAAPSARVVVGAGTARWWAASSPASWRGDAILLPRSVATRAACALLPTRT